ncbi:acyl-CoA dehydrogenase family protein [Paraburkholderia sediminicola]|uniref:acyl-CoA dehydrogenase family protein n=1 Tax=Paraburkholderia sediminicola TaxID=458836 RepID=UPI0038B73587
MREIFESTIERLLGDIVTPEVLRGSEAGAWPASLWSAIEESGFAVAAASEAQGGAGASWADLFVVVRAAGRHNLPLPLAETLLANALLGECGLEAINAPLGIAGGGSVTLQQGRVSGTLLDVPWGRHVGHVVAITAGKEPTLVLLDTADAQATLRLNTAGEPRDDLHFERAACVSCVPLAADLQADALQLGAAMLRSAQIAGALQAVLDLTILYATERVQFGKPIGAFQALQQQIAVLSEHAAAAAVAAECAFSASLDGAGGFAALPIAAAKVCSAEAASFATAAAHTVHGAIGFTHEHALHHSTRRLWSWRSEFGNATLWAQRLGAAVCAAGSSGLWPALTAGRLAPLERPAAAVQLQGVAA